MCLGSKKIPNGPWGYVPKSYYAVIPTIQTLYSILSRYFEPEVLNHSSSSIFRYSDLANISVNTEVHTA